MQRCKCLAWCAFFLTFACFAFNLSAQEPSSVIKIGAILPMTGDASAAGEAVKNGMTLALEKLPEATRKRIKLIIEDDALLPARTVTAFNKLVNSDKSIFC